MELVDALRKVPLFANVPEAGLRAIAGIGEPGSLAAGDVVLVEGGPADALYVILSGAARVYTERGGDVQQVTAIGPGEPFGASAVLEHASRSASVVATEPTEIVAFRAEPLGAILDADPAVAAPFYRALALAMFQRMRHTTDELGMARIGSSRR